MATRWWEGAVGYQVYVRSFADSDGDGIGDLPGIRSRLPYLAELGVDLVWITPFYPSPQADHGYDVADYVGVEPTYGTLEDVDALVADAHELGMRVVADLVPNHSSSEHPWFRAALRGEDPYVDYYVWRDPAPDGGPPNNWVSHFGGPAWTFSEERGQYYMHLFLPEQPDLNWANEDVRAEFDEILRFWFRRGLDGVRIDVAHSLVEDPDFRDNPLVGPVLPAGGDPGEVFRGYVHTHDLDQQGVIDVYRRWNAIAAEHDAVLIGEVYLLEPERLARYVADDALHSAFAFLALHAPWDGDALRDVLVRGVAHCGPRVSWPLSSHDDPHAAERFGGGEVGARRARAYFVTLSGLPGTPFLYQGDELGLDNGVVTGDLEDPIAVRNEGAVGRDGSRTPMPWGGGPNLGFTTGTPWLPLGENRTEAQTAAAQQGVEGSHLELLRAWLATRRGLADLTGDAGVTWLTGGGPLVAYRRGTTVVAMHTGEEPAELLGVRGEVVHVSHLGDDAPAVGQRPDGTLVVPPDTTVVVTGVGVPAHAPGVGR